jgi:hypothetical protein
MTGIIVPIQRNGRWENAELDELSDAELEALADSYTKESGWRWAMALAKWIRDNVHAVSAEEDAQ